MSKTVPLSFRLDPEVKDFLAILAHEDHRSLTNYVECVLLSHIEREKSKRSALQPQAAYAKMRENAKIY